MGQDFAISVEDAVKQYKIRHEKGRTLKEAFLRQGIYSETINALNHVSFDVARGSTMGLIGSNGSGKSTMLKLIAGTSRPNSGKVTVSGRVSALLELGAGFHPDFSGRENVYLDGIILGLTRKEIDERFDEIVAFAEMEEFVDAPAKTYSSGMYMRLAFAVAVSVDPDILLIDEVLAVGDESFQRKCLARINEFKDQGKTILFVSHGMETVRGLCEEAVWLDKGTLKANGPAEDVIDKYLSSVFNKDEVRQIADAEKDAEDDQRWGSRRAEITEVQLLDENGEEKQLFGTGDYMKVRIAFLAHERVEKPVLGILIRRGDGTVCFGTNTLVLGDPPDSMNGEGVLELEIKELPLLRGSYNLSLTLQKDHNGTEIYDHHERKYRFEVVNGPPIEIGVSHIPNKWLNKL